MPVDGGGETRVVDGVVLADFGLVERGIYYLRREAGRGAAVEFYEFATEQVSRVALLEGDLDLWGFFVSPDERFFLHTLDTAESDIMLVESFR